MKDTKVKFELNKSGLIALMQSQMMMDEVLSVAHSVGEVDTSYIAYDRAQAIVKVEGGKINAD